MAYIDPFHHCYNIIKGIMLNMGLKVSPHEPCLLSGVLANPSSPETIFLVQSKLHVGLYVENFVIYSWYPTQEALFKKLLQEHIQVDFMWDVEYFLGTEFTWLEHKDRNISAHLWQSEFTEFIDYWFLVHSANKVSNMTPYCSGFLIDSIPPIQLACDLHLYWHIPLYHLSCLIHKLSPPTILQGQSPCSKIPNEY